jgi:hypothetical protein
MPKLSKREQAKREKKAASSISTAPLPTSTPEPETSAAAEEKAQASLPHDVCEEDEDDRPLYVSQPETEEQAAARVAAYAAQGRDPWGVLLEPAVCAHHGCCCKRKVVQEAPYTNEECQELVNLWGWRLGAELILERNESWTLDDMYGHEMQVAWDDFCAMKERLADVLRAQEERSIAALKQQHIEEKVAVESRRNLGRRDVVVKKNIPCSRLYSCEGDRNSGGAKPTTMYVSSECWSHERMCPKTGRLLTPHVCPWLHPGEEGWDLHWNRNRLWRPAAAPVPVLPADAHWVDAAHRFAPLGGKKVEEAMAAPPTRQWAAGGGGGRAFVPPPPVPPMAAILCGGGAGSAAPAWGRGPSAAAPPPPPGGGARRR